MNTTERMQKVIEYTNKGPIALAVELGLSRTRIDGMIRKNVQAMPVVVAEAISRNYPTISRDWLLTGEGEMLTQKPTTDDNITLIDTPADAELQLMREELKMMRQELSLMRQLLSHLSAQNPQPTTHPIGFAAEPEPTPEPGQNTPNK